MIAYIHYPIYYFNMHHKKYLLHGCHTFKTFLCKRNIRV